MLGNSKNPGLIKIQSFAVKSRICFPFAMKCFGQSTWVEEWFGNDRRNELQESPAWIDLSGSALIFPTPPYSGVLILNGCDKKEIIEI